MSRSRWQEAGAEQGMELPRPKEERRGKVSRRKLTSWKSGGRKKKTVGSRRRAGKVRAPRPRLTHMAMSLASPGVRASSGPTSFTAEKWSWSWGQESSMWGSWYTSWRYGEKRLEGGDAERTERWHLRDRTGRGEHFLQEEGLQEGVWGAGRGLIWVVGWGGPLGGRG